MKEFQTIQEIGLAIENVKKVLRKHRNMITDMQKTLAKSLIDLEVVDGPTSRVAVKRKPMAPATLQKLEKKWVELQGLYSAKKLIEVALVSLQKPSFKITPTYSSMLSEAQATLLEINTTIENTKRLLHDIGEKAKVPARLKTLAAKVIERVRATIGADSYSLTVTAHPTPDNADFHYYAMIELNNVMVGDALYSEYFIILTCDDAQQEWSVGTTTRVEDIGKIRGLRRISLDGAPKTDNVFKQLNLLLHFDKLAPLSGVPLQKKLRTLPEEFSEAMFVDDYMWLIPAQPMPKSQLKTGTDNPEYLKAAKILRDTALNMIYNIFGLNKKIIIDTDFGIISVKGKKRKALRVKVTDLGFEQLNLDQINDIGELLNLKPDQLDAIKKMVL